MLYVHFITLSLTFHLGLDLPKGLFLSGFPTEILFVFLISPVNFSCPICRTPFQFTTHHHSLPSTNHAAPHCAVLSIPRYSRSPPFKTNISLIPCSSTIIPCSAATQTYIIQHNSVYLKLFVHNSVLLSTISVICMNSCIRYAVF